MCILSIVSRLQLLVRHKDMSEEHETLEERTWATRLLEKGKLLDIPTTQVDRLLNDLPNEEKRRTVFDHFFTRTGQPWAEPEGNRVFDPSENPLPPLRVLTQRKPLNLRLSHEPIDGYVLQLWNADDIYGFGSSVREAYGLDSGSSLLFVYPKKKNKKDNQEASDEPPPISAFAQKGQRCTLVDKDGEGYPVVVQETSADLETGKKGRRKTGYLLVSKDA
jgi:hypothetical protein